MSRVLVVHATNVLARGFEATSPDAARGQDGGSTSALRFVTRALLAAIGFKEPERAVAVLDAAVDPARLPPAHAAQLRRLREVLEAHGLRCVDAGGGGGSLPRAIDVVASYVAAARALGHDVVVVGSDKRLAQLVSDDVWWYDPYKDARYTVDMVRKRFDVGPDRVAEWLALVGDDDALPGIKGIGRKGATALLERFGSVRAALPEAASLGGRTGNALVAAGAAVEAEVARAALRGDAPLPMPLETLSYAPPDAETRQALYELLGFVSLLARGDAPPEVATEVCATPAAVEAALAALGPGPISLHALIGDPSPPRGALVGIALAKAGGPAFYVPADEPRLGALAPFLADPSRPKIGHDVKAAEVALARRSIPVAGVVADAACASHLHEPSNFAPQDLPILAKRILRRPLREEDEVRGVGRSRKGWGELPEARAAAFAGSYAEAAACVWEALAPTTDRALLDEYLALSETLVRMELRGVAVDAKDLSRAGDDFARIGAELEAEIYGLAGKEFNVNSTKQLGEVLFEQLGLPVVSRTKTGWSTATHALERIEGAHPIVPLVIRWRLLRRLSDTWVTALLAAIDPDGRVRSTFSPARSFSGRLVNANPDLGRVPGATPEMSRIRHAFRAPAGRALLSLDYRQLGLYVLAHLTKDPNLVGPLRDEADMHALTAAAVLDIPLAEVDRAARQRGKVVNFATFAGQGASALRMQLGITPREAKRYIARFDRRYAVARAFQEEQLRLARERGYIVTIAGRRWPIGDLDSNDAMIRGYAERLARRATHEGSVADVSRRGLLRADEALRAAGIDAFPLLQIHDEVLFEVAEAAVDEAAEIGSEAMRTAYELEVPLRVGRKSGPSWSELSPLG